MFRSLFWLFAVFTVVGCAPAGDTPEQPNETTVASVSTTPPELGVGNLAIFKDDDKVQIGEKSEDALSVFPKPNTLALSVNTLPRGFPAETYAADGWESDDGSEGFGVITVSVNSTKKVAVALQRTRVDTRDAADAIVASYKTQLATLNPTTQVSSDLTYTFWDEDKNRLMILEAPVKGGKWQLTLALGLKTLLVPLRIDPQDVTKDIDLLSRETAEPSKP